MKFSVNESLFNADACSLSRNKNHNKQVSLYTSLLVVLLGLSLQKLKIHVKPKAFQWLQ